MRIDEIPFLSWEQFLAQFKWKQGEHVTIIGPTGQGKTWLARAILHKRKYVVILITKRKDKMIAKFEQDGFMKVKEWSEIPHEIHPKILLQPPFSQTEPKEKYQYQQFTMALDRAFEQGSWTVYCDELPYLIEVLQLKKDLTRLWYQGRSQKNSLISSAQRPAFLPLLAYSSATHLFFFRTNDEADLKRMGGLGGISNKLIREAVSVLKLHEVLYLDTRRGTLFKTKVE